MTALLDVNVLIAGWATCPLTESGFVRVSSNRSAIPAVVSPAEAVLLLRRLVALDGHRFWVDDISIAATDLVEPVKLIAHRQVTDAHLLALVLKHGGRLITLDRRISSLLPQGRPEAVIRADGRDSALSAGDDVGGVAGAGRC